MQLARRTAPRHEEGLSAAATLAVLDAANHCILLGRRLSSHWRQCDVNSVTQQLENRLSHKGNGRQANGSVECRPTGRDMQS